MRKLEDFKVPIKATVRNAIRQMDDGGIGFCVCVNKVDVVLGVISDGDFRRAILNGIGLDECVDRIINREFKFVTSGYDQKEVEKIFKNTVAQHIPVLEEGKLVAIIAEEEFYGVKKTIKRNLINTPVVIMAGGKGTRLDPFTRILPKPLIPLGDDPVIKVIMDGFGQYGIKDFYISLNEKGKMIKAYFHDHELDYNITYIEENKPLGTAGSLKSLEGKMTEPIFVSNCDVIIKSDYTDMLKFHKQGKYFLTLVGSMKQYIIPYGICDIENGGDLKGIREKPKYDFLVNTGLYIIDPDILRFIPENTYFDMTDLIAKIKEVGLKIGVFPISEKSWIDIGQWSEYKDAVKKMC